MLVLAKFFAKILSILNSEISPKQIAAGFAYGVLLGLIPAKGLMPVVLLIIAFIININLALMGLSSLLFKILSFGVDPVANTIGYFLLVKSQGLKGFWTKLYNMPLVPYTRFNNTVVLGSLVIGVLLLIPAYFLAEYGVVQYRTRWRDKILKMKVVQMLKASTFYRFYESFQGIRGG